MGRKTHNLERWTERERGRWKKGSRPLNWRGELFIRRETPDRAAIRQGKRARRGLRTATLATTARRPWIVHRVIPSVSPIMTGSGSGPGGSGPYRRERPRGPIAISNQIASTHAVCVGAQPLCPSTQAMCEDKSSDLSEPNLFCRGW